MSNNNIIAGQLNFCVGDIKGNTKKIIDSCSGLTSKQLVVFPELAICGYPPKDLLLYPEFIDSCQDALKKITLRINCQAIIGAPYFDNNKLYNAAFLVGNGKSELVATKEFLPNYSVFEEERYFTSKRFNKFFEHNGKKLAVLICEDYWHSSKIKQVSDADIIISINASPFRDNILQQRLDLARQYNKDIYYVNLVGGQDELVFDGNSFSYTSGKFSFAPAFTEHIGAIDQTQSNNDEYHNYYQAIILGLKDYVHKNGFKKVLLGLSGGVDSALVALLSVQALGKDNVSIYALPTQYNSQQSFDDAYQLAKNLGLKLQEINIQPVFEQFLQSLQPQFANIQPDLTEENLQSRIRGTILMALSNKFGRLLLTTGNKSEIAVGYSTLYGDSCGAFNPIKDLYKTEVYNLCNWINQNFDNPIPDNIITKAPTAELRDNQKDSDSLPDYEVLDDILKQIIDDRKTANQIDNHPPNVVKNILKLVKLAEYKRYQAAPGVKLHHNAFGDDWKMPITNKWE